MPMLPAATDTLPGRQESPAPEKDSVASEEYNATVSSRTEDSQCTNDDLHRSPDRDQPKRRLTILTMTLYLIMFCTMLNTTIIATALPTISRDLRSTSGYAWLGSAFLVASAAACTIWIRVSDIWGRKPVLLVALAWFGAASLLAALSSSMEMLIVARALQGTAAGGLQQLVPVIFSDVFSLRRRALVIGFVGFVSALAGGIAPILGGTFAERLSWRFCFWVNLPLVAVSFVLVLLFLHVHKPKTPLWDGLKAIDWYGIPLLSGGIVMLLLGLDLGANSRGWASSTTICCFVLGGMSLASFVFVELRLVRYPLIYMHMLRKGSNIALALVVFSQGMLFIGADYYLPLYLQSVKQISPIDAGVMMVPLVVGATATTGISGVIVHYTGRCREIIWIATGMSTVAFSLFVLLSRETTIAQIVGLEIIAALGIGPLFQVPIIAVQTTVSQAETAAATATLGLILELAAAVSLVVGGVVFQSGIADQAQSLRHAGINNLQSFLSGEAAAQIDFIASLTDPTQKVTLIEAYASGLQRMWILYAVIGGVGFAASFFVVQGVLRHEHTEHETGITNLATSQTQHNSQ